MTTHKLEDIGFYTLSDERAKNASAQSRLMRCELVLTGRCNFHCPYCRRIGGPDIDENQARKTLELWISHGIYALRFSGGEPTLYAWLKDLVYFAASNGVERIALSTNGSAPLSAYMRLMDAGVNDFSISLDACCAEDNVKMTGGVKGAWETVTSNIAALAKLTYVTVGIVLTDDNADRVNNIVAYAASLGVADIRIIPAAQNGDRLKDVWVSEELLARFPILRYRMKNLRVGVPVRGIWPHNHNRCALVLDDMAVNSDKHYPCIIYMREGGSPIGQVGPNMRAEREAWYRNHNTFADRICRTSCLDVCAQYNDTHAELHA